jgi:hypothetical protein
VSLVNEEALREIHKALRACAEAICSVHKALSVFLYAQRVPEEELTDAADELADLFRHILRVQKLVGASLDDNDPAEQVSP